MVATILFLGANPSDTTHLALGREVREIDQRLLAAALREAFDLEQAWAVRTDDLQQSLLRYHPTIVHFSGHGNAAGQILVEDAHGSAVPVAPEALAGLFRILGRDIRCVVLNACYSEAQARAIVAHVDVVIGMSTAVEDWAAIAFAGGFYEALGHGEDVQAAFDLGCNRIDLMRGERHARRTRDLEADESVTFSQAEIPRLLVREGLLARDVWLAKRSAAASATATIELDLHIGPDLSASVADGPAWTPRDPFSDPSLARDLAKLRRLADAPLHTDERGMLAASESGKDAQLRALAERIGDALTDALLSPEARARIAAATGAAIGGPPPLLLLRVHAEDDSDAARRRADRLLALPWELLRLSGDFPVERGALDVAREAVVDGAQGLDAPDRELSVVATVAAPVNAVRLDYEGELYRLWRAMGAEERRLLLTDLGTAEALVDAVRAHRPVAMHFTGHGEPGVLLFEDDAARGAPLSVRDLVARLRGGSLPRLAFLASCYSAAVERADGGPAHHRTLDPAVLQPDPAWSSAAELHREGIHQVIAWLGPVEDGQCTRAEETVYAALVRGRSAREAVREARQKCREPLKDAQGRPTHLYPLGWAALALYHRGADVPTALPGTANGPDLVRKERERVIERLDKSRGPVGVERLKFGFVGRRTARAEMIRRFRDGSRVVVVHGLGGLGKTALCAELAPALAREMGLRDADRKRIAVRVVALDGRFAGQQADPVRALWDQVQALGAGDGWNLKLAELQKDGITGEAVAQAVAWLAREERGLLLYLDDAESLQVPVGDGELGAWKHPELLALWEGLMREAGRGPLALLASTRYVPEGVGSSACYALPVMREIDLVRMVRWWPAFGRLAAEDVAWLAERIEGHPRSLQWLDGYAREVMEKRAAPGRPFEGDLRREVLERVLPRRDAKLAEDLVLPRLIEAVGEEARGHLVRCAVLEEPAPWGAVLALEDVEGTGQRLARAGLLSAFEGARGGEPRWAPHRTVVEAAGRPSEEAAREACRRVGGWFREAWEREEGALDVAAQAARYLCAAGDGDGAWEPARRLVLGLRRMGRYREALGWVERALDAGASGERRGKALAFRGQLGRLSGAPPGRAEQQLKEAVELVALEDRGFVLSELGGLLRHQGRLQEAVTMFEQAIAVDTEVSGEVHANVAGLLHLLAGVLKAQGDLAGAREHLERSLRIWAKVFGTDEHPSVAASLHELAGVLKAQGDLAGAREHLERSLRIKAKVFGTDEHPSVAASLHELTGVLKAQGDLAGAREHLERSLRIKAKVFGTDEHPSVAASLHSLAGVLKAQGDLAGAREHLERVLAIEERVYGTRDHYATAITETDLGALLLKSGEVERGAALILHAYRVFLAQLGPDHPYTRQLATLFGGEE